MRITRTVEESPDVFTICLDEQNDGSSGQFYMVSVPATGEAAISVAAGHGRKLEFTIRRIGTVTGRIKGLEEVGVRGPYGTSWPWREYDEIVAVAGGVGIPPIKSLIEEMTDSGRQGRLEVLYGARTPSDILYKDRVGNWLKEIDLHLTVDREDPSWGGHVGFVPSLLKQTHKSRDAALFVIGPPLMMMNTIKEALNQGFREERIFLSLERRMECGIGVCGHCNVGEFYVCEDGPIFQYGRVKGLPELFL